MERSEKIMINKALIIEHVIDEYEGGYVNNPLDNGGETKYGITKARYPKLDIRNLTKDEAILIYRKDYWGRFLDDVQAYTNDQITSKAFAFVINRGIQNAVTAMQMAINSILLPQDDKLFLTVDGLWGTKSKSALKIITKHGEDESSIKGLGNAFYLEMIRQYHKLCVKNPKYNAFLKSWIRRVID